MSGLVEDALRLAVALLSVLVFIVGAAAYARRPTPRMLLVLALFLVLLVQGALLAFEVFVADTSVTESAYYAFQLVEVGLLAFILVKR